MLENTSHGAPISNTRYNRLRKAWSKLLRSFFSNSASVQRGLQGVGEPGISGRLDEEVPEDFSASDEVEIIETSMPAEKVQKTREEIFSESTFEWVKSERSGDVCKFSEFEIENDIEYTKFIDGTRVRTDLIGDVVLMHQFSSEILGNELFAPVMPRNNTILDHLKVETRVDSPLPAATSQESTSPQDPVVAILEKTKKKTEKITLTLTVKIPSPDLYNVIKENFDNVDEILLQSVLSQIQEETLKDALKRELQNIYAKKKKV